MAPQQLVPEQLTVVSYMKFLVPELDSCSITNLTATHMVSFTNYSKTDQSKIVFEVQTSSSSNSRSGEAYCSDAPFQVSESESNSGDSDITTKSTLSSPLPVKCKKKVEKRTFKKEWKVKYLTWPVKNLHAGNMFVAGAAKSDETEMMCIHCQETMKAKSNTVMRHLQRKTPLPSPFLREKEKGWSESLSTHTQSRDQQ